MSPKRHILLVHIEMMLKIYTEKSPSQKYEINMRTSHNESSHERANIIHLFRDMWGARNYRKIIILRNSEGIVQFESKQSFSSSTDVSWIRKDRVFVLINKYNAGMYTINMWMKWKGKTNWCLGFSYINWLKWLKRNPTRFKNFNLLLWMMMIMMFMKW